MRTKGLLVAMFAGLLPGRAFGAAREVWIAQIQPVVRAMSGVPVDGALLPLTQVLQARGLTPEDFQRLPEEAKTRQVSLAIREVSAGARARAEQLLKPDSAAATPAQWKRKADQILDLTRRFGPYLAQDTREKLAAHRGECLDAASEVARSGGRALAKAKDEAVALASPREAAPEASPTPVPALEPAAPPAPPAVPPGEADLHEVSARVAASFEKLDGFREGRREGVASWAHAAGWHARFFDHPQAADGKPQGGPIHVNLLQTWRRYYTDLGGAPRWRGIFGVWVSASWVRIGLSDLRHLLPLYEAHLDREQVAVREDLKSTARVLLDDLEEFGRRLLAHEAKPSRTPQGGGKGRADPPAGAGPPGALSEAERNQSLAEVSAEAKRLWATLTDADEGGLEGRLNSIDQFAEFLDLGLDQASNYKSAFNFNLSHGYALQKYLDSLGIEGVAPGELTGAMGRVRTSRYWIGGLTAGGLRPGSRTSSAQAASALAALTPLLKVYRAHLEADRAPRRRAFLDAAEKLPAVLALLRLRLAAP